MERQRSGVVEPTNYAHQGFFVFSKFIPDATLVCPFLPAITRLAYVSVVHHAIDFVGLWERFFQTFVITSLAFSHAAIVSYLGTTVKSQMEQDTGHDPVTSAWKADALPLRQSRMSVGSVVSSANSRLGQTIQSPGPLRIVQIPALSGRDPSGKGTCTVTLRLPAVQRRCEKGHLYSSRL